MCGLKLKSFLINGIPIFSKPPRETKIGSRNQKVREIERKNAVFDEGRETTFGSSYQEFRKIEGSRNRDSTVENL